MLVFAGFLVFFRHMQTVMYYLSYTSVLRFALEGTVIAVYGNNRTNLYCPEDVLYCHYK